MKINQKKFSFSNDTIKMLIIGVLIGVACFVWSFLHDSERAWINYLVNANYFVSLSLGGAFIIALMTVTNSSFFVPYKRIIESLMSFLPIGLIIMLGLYFGINSLFEWSHESVLLHDKVLQGKSAYLNPTFFMIRIVVFFALWIFITKMMAKLSLKQDQQNYDNKTSIESNQLRPKEDFFSSKILKWSCIFIIVYGFSFSLASFDWLMSLRADWYSTIFAVYNFSGMILSTFAVITYMIIWLKGKGFLAGVVNENHIHDLAKFIFGFSTFWAYIWISQYLLVWYSNMPHETVYFIAREKHTWDWLFYLNIVVNWVVPFLVLVSRKSKRSMFVVSRVCILLIIGRWLDLYLMVAPDVYERSGNTSPHIGVIEIGIAVGFGCLFALVIAKTLSKHNLVAVNDPYLEEGINLKQ